MDEKINPREKLWRKIRNRDMVDILNSAAELHGHYCPGLSLGVNAGVTAISEKGLKHEGMEDVLAVVETNNCFSDGIQYTTGCSFGNNSLIFRDFGKTAFTLTDRSGEGIRITVRKDAGKNWEDEFPEYKKLFEKVVEERNENEEAERRFMEVGKKVSKYIVEVDPDKIFNIEKVKIDLPNYAPIHESKICSKCSESVMETRTVEKDDKIFCLECGEADYYELTGFGMKLKKRNLDE